MRLTGSVGALKLVQTTNYGSFGFSGLDAILFSTLESMLMDAAKVLNVLIQSDCSAPPPPPLPRPGSCLLSGWGYDVKQKHVRVRHRNKQAMVRSCASSAGKNAAFQFVFIKTCLSLIGASAFFCNCRGSEVRNKVFCP